MQDLLMMSFQSDPLWMAGVLFFSCLPVMAYLLSLVRHPREEWWFHLLLPLVAGVFLLGSWLFPYMHEQLVSYRSDWSWVYLVQHPGLLQIMTLWFFLAMTLYAFSFCSFFVMISWSTVTFRFDRLLTLLRRSSMLLSAPLFFSGLIVLSLIVVNQILPTFSFFHLRAVVQFGLFVFSLHLYLLSVDSAVFFRPRQLFRFCLISGMSLVLCSQLVMLSEQLMIQNFDVKQLFAQTLIQFFLGVLMSAYYAAAFVQARFASHAYIQVCLQQLSPLQNFFLMVFLSPQERTFIGQTMMKGIGVCFLVGVSLLSVCFQGFYLVAVPMVFFGYFLMFYLLDWQFDLLEKGHLVQERAESLDAVSRALVTEWQYRDDDLIELSSSY